MQPHAHSHTNGTVFVCMILNGNGFYLVVVSVDTVLFPFLF